MMSRIRSKDTRPELRVRSVIFGLGYRYRVHAKDLPGKPDIVFRSRKKIIFIHGCFWHAHPGCARATVPKTRRYYWESKLSGNVMRDEAVTAELTAAGWEVLVIWECETQSDNEVADRVRSFLGPVRIASRAAQVA